MEPKIWEEIIGLYLKCKKVYIRAEEESEEFRAPLSYLAALRDAFDLTMPLIAENIGSISLSEEEKRNFAMAARGHMRRAFFDICDYLSMSYKTMIASTVKPYPPHIISTAIPDYYSEYAPFILEINDRIIEYRQQKGLHHAEDTDYEGYMEVVDKLGSIYKKISSRIPTLYDLMNNLKRQEEEKEKAARKEKRRDFIKGALLAIIIGVLLELLF